MVDTWKVRKSEQINSYKVFSTRRDISRSTVTGEEHDFYVIQSPDWINVIPVTADGEVILIRQFRHGTQSVTLEIPGGMVDNGEDPLAAAKRELAEETGYGSEKWEKLGTVHPNPAIMDNECHMYLAGDAFKSGEPHFDGTEDIETVTRPVEEVKDLILEGGITHSLVLSAFNLYFLRF